MFTFSSVPAIPTTLQPNIFPICPTILPTAPAAPEIIIVSPFLGFPISVNPRKAVIPVIPNAPRYTDSPTSEVSTTRSPSPELFWNSFQASIPDTNWPTLNFSFCDSTISAITPETIGLFSSKGSA